MYIIGLIVKYTMFLSGSSSNSSSSSSSSGTWPPQLSDFTVHDIVVVKVILLYMTVIV